MTLSVLLAIGRRTWGSMENPKHPRLPAGFGFYCGVRYWSALTRDRTREIPVVVVVVRVLETNIAQRGCHGADETASARGRLVERA